MRTFDETLDRISRSGEAVFAIDGADRIILWNKACETLVGKPAKAVLGRPCYDVMCGRDANGNLYCHRSCAVAYQARERKEDPVRRFELKVATGSGKPRKVSSSLFAVPSYHPALTTVVHVLRPAADAPASVPAPEVPDEPLTPMTNGEGETVALTPERRRSFAASLRACRPRPLRRSSSSLPSPSGITSRTSCRSSACTPSSRPSCWRTNIS